MVFFNFISCTKKSIWKKNRIFAKKFYYYQNDGVKCKKYQPVKKLFNRVILWKLEVFGEYFVDEAETEKVVGRTAVFLDVKEIVKAYK